MQPIKNTQGSHLKSNNNSSTLLQDKTCQLKMPQ